MVHGYKLQLRTRCDFCNRKVDQVYAVKDDICTGKFCSRDHYTLARNKMENSKKKDQDE